MQVTNPPQITIQQIAGYSRPDIEAMPDDTLARVVRAARLPFLTADDIARLSYIGRTSLLRLGFLAREFCRNQSRDTRWSALSE